MLRITESWIEEWGVLVGLVLVFTPIAYDIIGWCYGRHIGICIEGWGSLIQVGGGLLALGGRVLRWRYRK